MYALNEKTDGEKPSVLRVKEVRFIAEYTRSIHGDKGREQAHYFCFRLSQHA